MQFPTSGRILLYGGSFDPPHVAHVKLPALAMRKINAVATAYIPAAQQPLKPDGAHASASHRLAMLELALQGLPHTIVLTNEIDRAATSSDGGASYTVDTLEQLRAEADDQVELRLLIGVDQLLVFDRWRCWQRILELAEPVVMLRPPQTRQTLLASLPAGFDRNAWKKRLVDLPLINVSSSDVRRRSARGLPLDGLVPSAVARYIDRHDLYRAQK